MTSLCMERRKKYDERLEAVLTRLIRARITLNQGKCKFSRTQLKFAGNSFSAQGMGSDPGKTAAIEKMERPQMLQNYENSWE